MRELTQNEIEQVNGGVVPVIGFAAALGGHLLSRGLLSWAASSTGLVTGTYGLMEYMSSR